MLLTVGRSYVGNDVTHSTLLDRACACSYENLPRYRSYRISNTPPWNVRCRLQKFGRVAVEPPDDWLAEQQAMLDGSGVAHCKFEVPRRR